MESNVKVRFAPSPTGFLHIGGARTALFNWLYAKHARGKFILRIEDTDLERSKKEYLDEILDSLAWLKMNWDELYYQSQRFDIYRQYAEKLLKEGKAYTAENGALIFKVEPQKIKINDIIRGEIEFDSELIKDQVLIKEDKSPTYNFACVVDDALLGITHVLRGDDHISNTPKQTVLYAALGFKVPFFAHLPLILGKDGGRLSKRTGATAISDYRKMGYLPEALTNYFLLLGWSPGGNQEVVNIEEIIKKFEIKNINKTAAIFDMDKLNWLNSQYIKKADSVYLVELLIPRLIEAGYIKKENFNREEISAVVKLFQGRISTLEDFVSWSDFIFLGEVKFEEETRKKLLERNLSKEFGFLIERFEKITDFNHAAIEEEFRGLVNELGIKVGELVHPVRIALSGKTIGPGLFETIAILGKEKTRERLTMAKELWKNAGQAGFKCLLWLSLLICSAGFFSGCATIKGMGEDAMAIVNCVRGQPDDSALSRADRWMRENWW
ncbi:MAG: glutamate--tRNA ligase [Candidatus Omnitrophota bacterium]|nr:glutamate--tRNA ligase [Candidatus Omnitrophota bacterium]